MSEQGMQTHKLGSGANGKGVPLPEQHLTLAQAVKELGISRRTFDRWQRDGFVPQRWRKPDGSYLFDADDIAGLKDLTDERGDDGPLDAPTAELLKQAYEHNHVLLKTTVETCEKLIAMQGSQVEALLARCGKLEETHGTLIDAREAALDRASERQAMAETLAAEQARKDKALSHLADGLPKLFAAYQTNKLRAKGATAVSTGTPSSSNPMPAPDGSGVVTPELAARFVQSLSPEQLAMATALEGFWDGEQVDILKTLQQAAGVQGYEPPIEKEEEP